MTPSYELAKQLKDAEFPHTHNEACYFGITSEKDVFDCVSLEELIEACGKDFYSVNQNETNDGKSWSAESWASGEVETGSTPTEAVANLWLALKDKKA